MSARLAFGVVALVDASPAAANAAWRAALVARDHRAPLRLLSGDALALAALAADIEARLRLRAETQELHGDLLAQAVQAARAAGLLVIGARRGNLLRAFVLGTPAERLVRLSRAPVLVVKRPATGSYRRVLVPVDLGPHAAAVVETAAAFSRDPRMEVLHALPLHEEVAMRAIDLPAAVVRRQRSRVLQRAHQALEELIAGAGPQVAAQPAVTFGDPTSAVLQRERALRAELVVVGKRRHWALADFFLGSVTQRLLARAQADVLVLPLAQQGVGRPLEMAPGLAPALGRR